MKTYLLKHINDEYVCDDCVINHIIPQGQLYKIGFHLLPESELHYENNELNIAPLCSYCYNTAYNFPQTN